MIMLSQTYPLVIGDPKNNRSVREEFFEIASVVFMRKVYRKNTSDSVIEITSLSGFPKHYMPTIFTITAAAAVRMRNPLTNQLTSNITGTLNIR